MNETSSALTGARTPLSLGKVWSTQWGARNGDENKKNPKEKRVAARALVQAKTWHLDYDNTHHFTLKQHTPRFTLKFGFCCARCRSFVW